VSVTSWVEQKKQLQEKYGPRKNYGETHCENCRYIIAKIKRALTRNQLSSLIIAVRHLHNNPEQVPVIVNQLNALISHRHLFLQWLPDNHGEPAALLLRNSSIGLLIKTEPDFRPEGMMLIPVESGCISSLTPEAALSALSL
jgi:hypothetical protein